MSYSKKRKAKQNEPDEGGKCILQGFSESLAAIEKWKDPVQKLLSFQKKEEDTDAVIGATKTGETAGQGFR